MKCFHIFLLSILSFASCKGQNKASDNNTPKLVKTQGSTEYDNVHCGLMDKAGNLWFGTTKEGVYKYDGSRFTQFTEKDGLSNNTVWCILEDTEGNIWFGTDNGISKYDGKKISAISIAVISNDLYTAPIAKNNSGKNAVWSMLQDRTGRIWFGTDNDLYLYDGKRFARMLDDTRIMNESGLTLRSLQSMLEDKNGNIWLGSGPLVMEGVCLYDGKSIIASKPNGDGWIRSMLQDRKGNIWFNGRSNGIFIYDGTAFEKFTEKENTGSALLEDSRGNIWFGGGEHDDGIHGAGGIWRYDGRSFTNFTAKDDLGDHSVWCMVEDKDGNIWVGTRNVGLYKYDGKSFVRYSE